MSGLLAGCGIPGAFIIDATSDRCLLMGRIFVAATSTLRAARSPPIIPLARIFLAAPIAARRWRGEAFARFVSTRGDIDAMLGIGGGGGTFIVTKGMLSLRIGVPKLMGSTVAAGDVGRYVNVADISMMPSVTTSPVSTTLAVWCCARRRSASSAWPARGRQPALASRR